MPTIEQWVHGARPRTLAAAVAPVAVGTGAAYAVEQGIAGFGVLALLVALSLQVGVNYANDYSDGVRGTDATASRVGPWRLVGQGLASPVSVKIAALISFAVAALCGLTLLALADTLWMLLPGAAAIAAAWLYTGGPRPYGYLGLGEVMVFVFFGLFATAGTTYTQALYLTPATIAGSIAVGCLSCAILMVNNLRDIDSDALVGKRTLAVRLGTRRSRIAYATLMLLPYGCALAAGFFHPGAWAALLTAPLAISCARTVLGGASGTQLVHVLSRSGLTTLAFGLAYGAGIAIWRIPVLL